MYAFELVKRMSNLWFCYGLLLIGILYYVRYNVSVHEINGSIVVEHNITVVSVMKPYETTPTSASARLGASTRSNSEPNDINKTADVFDYCPFKAPDPWDKSVLQYMDVKYGYLKDCTPDERLSPVTDLRERKVVLKEGIRGFDCLASCIEYAGDNQYTRGWWSPIDDTAFDCDFVETKCNSGTEIKRYIHMQIAEQKSTADKNLDPQRHPDVVLMVIDSVASTQLIRALPRTVNFLLHGMEAIEFRKFNKVGSNSRPNAFAALVGKTTEAIIRNSMNLPTIPADLTYDQLCNSYLDDEPYVPLLYKKAGYKMFGAEDYVASILNYPDCLGTKTRQFQHSFRPFIARLNRDDHLESVLLQGACRLIHDAMLNYLTQFVNSYEGSPKFSLTWFAYLTHDDSQLLYRSDYEMYNFFLKNRDALNNSFIFFFGDHGPRFGLEAYTEFGIREQNNPFLYVVLPKHLRHSKLHQQVLANSQELVTHHDLHSTFVDILYNQPAADFSDLSFKRFDSNLRGSSLLRQFERGVERTCKTLPIPFQYCICQYKKERVTDNGLVLALGRFAANGLAAVLETEKVTSLCEEIVFGNNIETLKYVVPRQDRGQPENSLYEVIFVVAAPALGRFRILIREDSHGNFELAGEQFDRLDKYGKHGDCMTKDTLRPLCTCRYRRAR